MSRKTIQTTINFPRVKPPDDEGAAATGKRQRLDETGAATATAAPQQQQPAADAANQRLEVAQPPSGAQLPAPSMPLPKSSVEAAAQRPPLLARPPSNALLTAPSMPGIITRAGWYSLDPDHRSILGYWPRALDNLSSLLSSLMELPWEVRRQCVRAWGGQEVQVAFFG